MKFLSSLLHRSAPHWARAGLLLGLFLGLPLGLGVFAPPALAQANTVTLNFVNAEITEVARAIAIMTGRNLVVDPRVHGSLNMVSDHPVSTSDAYDQFLSAVRLQGYTVVETAGVYKLIPEAEARQQSNTLIDAGSSVRSPSQLRGNQIATQVFTLNYENANNMASVLRPLMGQGSSITINASNNSLIITDYADNLQRAARIIASQDIAKGTDLEVIPLHNASANDIAPLVAKLIESNTPQGGGAASAPTILADTRSNALIVRAANPMLLSQIRNLAQSLDRDMQSSGATDAVTPGVYVVKLKSGDATKIAATLRSVLPAGANTVGQVGSVATSTVQVQADTTTNSLVITAPDAQYRQLKAVIDKLDQRPAQVFIESLIAEVNSNKVADFGIQWQGSIGNKGDSKIGVIGTNFGTGLGNIIGAATANASSFDPTQVPNGMNFGVFKHIGSTYVLGMLANFLQTTGDGNILATPNVLTLDNEESRVIVGQNVPFITGSYQQTNNTVSNPFQTIERKDVGMTLRVKPQINEDGSIKLKIFQEISNIDPTSKTNPAGLITNKRSIETNVIVDNGSIVVLGGLLQDEYDNNQTKVPLLGDIPGIGALFKSEGRTRTKTNLMVFIRPTILRTEQDNKNFSENKYADMRSTQQQTQPGRHLIFDNKPVPSLPERPMDNNPAQMNMTMSLPQSSLKLSNSSVELPTTPSSNAPSPLDKLYRQNQPPSSSLSQP